jgi:ketosteroid isomerase-like protein
MVHVTPKTAGASMVMQNGKYLVILQKQTDGSWKIARDINNSSDPSPAPAAAPAATAK